MPLLPAFERLQLPPPGSHKDNEEPTIHLHFYVPDSPSQWYVTEGSPVGDDFVFFVFHISSELEENWKWEKFGLSDLKAFGSDNCAVVVRDPEFKAGLFTDVIPHPYLNRDFSN